MEWSFAGSSLQFRSLFLPLPATLPFSADHPGRGVVSVHRVRILYLCEGRHALAVGRLQARAAVHQHRRRPSCTAPRRRVQRRATGCVPHAHVRPAVEQHPQRRRRIALRRPVQRGPLLSVPRVWIRAAVDAAATQSRVLPAPPPRATVATRRPPSRAGPHRGRVAAPPPRPHSPSRPSATGSAPPCLAHAGRPRGRAAALPRRRRCLSPHDAGGPAP